MAHRETIIKWHTAICFIELQRYQDAATMLHEIREPSAKILYDLGCVSMLQSAHQDAVQHFSASVDKDKYLAIAYYQRGSCYHDLQRYDRAELDFLTAKSLIPSDGIDYKQLGAEVLLTPHLLDQCVAVSRDCYITKLHQHLHSLPVTTCIFKPPKQKVDNLGRHDFLGKSKVISSTTETDILYAAEKQQTSFQSRKNQVSISLPSSPLSSRRPPEITKVTKMVIPPPPRRPPPRLSKGTLEIPKDTLSKSKSCEDIMSSPTDHDYEDIDDDDNEDDKNPRLHTGASPLNHGRDSSKVYSLARDLNKSLSSPPLSGQPNPSCVQNKTKVVIPQQTINQGRLPQSSAKGDNITSQSKTIFSGIDSNPIKSNKTPPVVGSQNSNICGSSDTNIGHTARMKSLFERGNDQGNPVGQTRQIKDTQSNRLGLTKTQSTPASSVAAVSEPQKPTRPPRPPPPKVNK